MSDTPRTDVEHGKIEQAVESESDIYDAYCNMRQFARQLERELTDAKREISVRASLCREFESKGLQLERELAEAKARLEEIGDLKHFLGVPIGTFNPDKVSFYPVGDGTYVLKVVNHGFLLDRESAERLAGELPHSKREDKWRECAREVVRLQRRDNAFVSADMEKALACFDELEKGEK